MVFTGYAHDSVEQIIITRFFANDKQAIGSLTCIDSKANIVCVLRTLELLENNNLKRRSSVPRGTYFANKFNSPRHGKVVLLRNVVNRDFIEIHAGNFFGDTLGCILVGEALADINKDGYYDTIRSRNALRQLLFCLKDTVTVKIM